MKHKLSAVSYQGMSDFAPIDLRGKSGHGCPCVWISTRRFGGPKPGYGCPHAGISLRRNPWGAKSAGGLRHARAPAETGLAAKCALEQGCQIERLVSCH